MDVGSMTVFQLADVAYSDRPRGERDSALLELNRREDEEISTFYRGQWALRDAATAAREQDFLAAPLGSAEWFECERRNEIAYSWHSECGDR